MWDKSVSLHTSSYIDLIKCNYTSVFFGRLLWKQLGVLMIRLVGRD